MNRLESARIAAWKAKDAAEKAGWAEPRTIGSAVASDAFFPFADGLLAAVEAGATAVIQTGGSIRDDEVIAAADAAGLGLEIGMASGRERLCQAVEVLGVAVQLKKNNEKNTKTGQ